MLNPFIQKMLTGLFCLLPLLSVAQTEEINITDANGKKQGNWSKLFANGQTRYLGQFKDDEPVGKWCYFDEAGDTLSVLVYTAIGKANATIFHEKNKVMGKGVYLNKKRDGLWKFYSVNGHMVSEEMYTKGVKSGISKVYYSNGQLMKSVTYSKDLLEGPVIEYFENGTKKMEGNYVNGKLEGRVKRYHPNGMVHSMGNYTNGAHHGKWIVYDSAGKLTARQLWRHGILIENPEDAGNDETGN